MIPGSGAHKGSGGQGHRDAELPVTGEPLGADRDLGAGQVWKRGGVRHTTAVAGTRQGEQIRAVVDVSQRQGRRWGAGVI